MAAEPGDLRRRLAALDPPRRAALVKLLAERGAEYGVHPLSSAQRRLWLAAELHPDSAVYNVPYAFRLTGALDVAALAQAVSDVVRRHDALRTVFFAIDGEPRQVVRQDLAVDLSVEEHPEVPAADRDAFALEHAAAEAARPFDLATGPLVRARLLRFDHADALLLLTLHHIVCDGWSMRIVFDDLERCYAARLRGAVDQAPAAPQYPAFARWQAQRLDGPTRERLLEHWTTRLAGAPPVLDLPTDRPRPPVPAFKGGIEWFEWPARLADAVRSYAAGQSATEYQVLLAALIAVLYRYTGQDDLVVGTPAANRTRVETEATVGFFVNPLPVRARLHRGMTFRELTARAREAVIEAQAHQDLPFELLVDALRVDRGVSHHPLFQVAFTAQAAGDEALRLAGVRVARVPSHSGTAKLDLTLGLTTGADTLAGGLEYDRGLFDMDTVRAFLNHLRVLLTAAVADPDQPVGGLPMLADAERRRLLHDWNATTLPVAADRLVHELIEAQVDATPDAPAVACGGDRLTYQELDRAANRLAHRLVRDGVAPGSVVGILLDRSVHLAVCALAVWKSGAAYLPLDPAHPQERLRYMLEDSAVDVVITDDGLRDRLPPGQRTLGLDEPATPEAVPDSRPPRRARPDDLAYVIYTSGSTGRPKGVMVPHRGVCNLATAMSRVLAPAPGDRLLAFASFSFDAAVADMLLALTSGAELWFAPREAIQPGADLAETIRAAGITMVVLPPTAAALLAPADVPSLRTLAVAGEPCPPDLAATWPAACTMFNAYGPTEASVCATVARVCGWEPRVPIGSPLANVQVYVLDEQMQPVPRGAAGEIYIGGPGVARGYVGRPDLTAERFLPDPVSGRRGARLYRTGDIGRHRLDGQLEFLGRVDGQVKIRGLRIELGEVQAVLCAQPGVRVAVVTTRDDGRGARLVAYLVPEPGARPDPIELRRGMRELLPEYMIPASFVTVDTIPQTVHGKVDHAELARMAPAPVDPARAAVPPRTELQRRVAEVWREVLGVAEVGLHDNFFDLGGNSLLITRLRARLEQELDRPVATLTLFRYPTVNDLAAALGGESAPGERAADEDRGAARARARQALRARSRRRRPDRTDQEDSDE